MANVISIQPEHSNHIAKLTYDPGAELLRVRFTNDYVYTYSNVPADIFAALTRQQSMGTYFSRVIKKNYPLVSKYKAQEKLNEPPPAAEPEMEQ